MQIRVKCSCGESNCPEWAVVELQGMVEVQSQFQDRLHNLHIGLLCRPSASSQDQTYTFTVGYHELTGTKQPLKKPLLVLRKLKPSRDAGVELEVIGIIRHRILFNTRPMALISSKHFTLFLHYFLKKKKNNKLDFWCTRIIEHDTLPFSLLICKEPQPAVKKNKGSEQIAAQFNSVP